MDWCKKLINFLMLKFLGGGAGLRLFKGRCLFQTLSKSCLISGGINTQKIILYMNCRARLGPSILSVVSKNMSPFRKFLIYPFMLGLLYFIKVVKSSDALKISCCIATQSPSTYVNKKFQIIKLFETWFA